MGETNIVIFFILGWRKFWQIFVVKIIKKYLRIIYNLKQNMSLKITFLFFFKKILNSTKHIEIFVDAKVTSHNIIIM